VEGKEDGGIEKGRGRGRGGERKSVGGRGGGHMIHPGSLMSNDLLFCVGQQQATRLQ